jgi:hypothetical protein
LIASLLEEMSEERAESVAAKRQTATRWRDETGMWRVCKFYLSGSVELSR